VFDFWANHPQSLHQATILMSDHGIPLSHRHQHGFGSHTLSFWNRKGERFWVKWHLKTNQGIKCLTNAEAAAMPANGAQRDMVESIDKGDFPSWTVKLQIMTEEQGRTYRINPFDLTKVWPYKDFPLIEIGKLELNRNVDNYFAEVEQSAFAPSNLVPGVGASPDKMLQARLLAYQDAHRYRIGVNANQLPVNAPKCPVNHNQRDGAMAGMCPMHGGKVPNQDGGVHFYPNDRPGSPSPSPEFLPPPMPVQEKAWIKPHDQELEDYFGQAGDLYRVMSDSQKDQLADNIAGGLVHATASAQERMLVQYGKADPDYRKRVEAALKRHASAGR
jgi:catalase